MHKYCIEKVFRGLEIYYKIILKVNIYKAMRC